MNITWDRETTGLLDETAIDYCAVPYKLKDSFKTHCIVVEEHETGKVIAFYDGPTYVLDGREYKETVEGVTYTLKDYIPIEYEHRPKKEFKAYILETKPKRVVAHNQIQFDLLVGKLEEDMDYDLFPETWCGLPVEFTDTLVKAKCLNPDRLGGNSLEALAEKTGVRKVDFRPYIVEAERFKHFAADMLYYCIRDVKANTAVDLLLQKEEGDWNWKDAIQLEKEVKFVITIQEHRGFKYDKELASNCIEELDTLMEERRVKIEPILPPKAPTKAFEKTVTPPARQFLKTGGYSEDMKKFVDKHAGKLLGPNADSVLEVELFGSVYSLPIAREPLVKEVPATLNDSTHIKEWLVGMGWMPSEYQEKDLSVKTGKIKKTREEFEESVEKYVAQTLASSFCDDRCEYLETTPEQLRQRLLRTKEGRSCKVLTNPKFTKGQEKEICPNLEAMSEKFPYARDIVDYLTYKHRRNSILGGGLEWDEEEEAEKGFLAYVRADGRISTPADTCGAATSRFKHRVVTNIPRTSSLYGEPMRAQFGVDDTCYQIGYDFDSLEAKEEAHFCWRYDKDKQYCNSLTMEKPNDVHCYAEDTEILTSTGWKLFGDIDCEDKVAQWDNNEISFVKPLGIVWQDYSGKMVSIKNKVMDQLVTPNHRVFTVDPRSGLTTVREAMMFVNMTSQFSVPISGVYQKESTSDFVRLLVAVQADGCMAKDCTAVQFTFVKARKYKRLLWLLEANSAEYSVGTHTRKGRVEYRVRIISKGLGEKIHAILGLHKKLPYSLIEEGYGKLIVEESKFWDGTERNSSTSVLDTTCQYTRDFLQACGAVNGYNVYCQTYINKKGSFGSCTIHRCLINEGTHTKTFKASRDVELVDYVGKIGCVSVPSGLVLVRRNGKVCVSGNTIMAKKISSIISKEFSRTPAKSVKYGATYGATEKKVAKIIGESLYVGTQVYNAFWEAAMPLKMLKEKLKVYWETIGGKKFILGIDGRKVPTRSQHAILNSLFQSAGVICAKRAMVIHYRKLKAEGYIVDFFKDDWTTRKYCQQLIAYHDEAQLEVSKALVQFKMFATKEEAQAFKDGQDKVWSDIKDSPKGGVFVAYSRPGELATEAVKEAGEYYKLNVELTAGYVVGKNWAMCH